MLQDLNTRHKMHTERLEQVQRALDNEAVTIEQVDAVKESLEDYIVRAASLAEQASSWHTWPFGCL